MQKNLQPNSHRCFVCGLANPNGLQLRFFNQGIGRVVAEYTIPDHFQGYPGVAHGGIVAAMLDEASARSQMFKDPAGPAESARFMVTARLDIRYRRNVPVSKPLQLVGEAGKDRGRTAQAKAFLFEMGGILLAEADALLIDVPQDMLRESEPESLGWRIYPEEEKNHDS